VDDTEPASANLPSLVRICLVYDCLFPHTVGGAERWYRNLGERLAAEGHDVTYLTLRQWDRGEDPGVPGVRVIAVGPRMALYASGRRRILPPVVFGLGVLGHLLWRGRRYDVVHTASFPYFSLLAAGALRRLRGYRLVVDWHEVWSREYWIEYLGPRAGPVGAAIQRMCIHIAQHAFCFSRLHAGRLRAGGLRGEVTVLEGEYTAKVPSPARPRPAEPLVVFAGRHIPEKRAPAVVGAVVAAARRIPELRGVIFGDGPERADVVAAIGAAGVQDTVSAPGFVAAEEVDSALGRALCMLLPSRREGYGLIVVEAASQGVPSIVVAGSDNAATELIAEGENGTVAPSADAVALGEAILRVHEAGAALRESTLAWYRRNESRLSLESSLARVLESYGGSAREPARAQT
jgi:glycosyltransferase involved in cell wall biosynthesis